MEGNQFNEYHGITVEALVCRKDRRWTIWVMPGSWIETDMRAELEEGFTFVMDRGTTNGIYLKQVKREE